MKAIINYRYRRMAQSTGDKCRLPLFMLTTDKAKEELLIGLKALTEQEDLSFTDEGLYSSVWIALPANTIFELSEEDEYPRILSINNKFSEIDWSVFKVYLQRSHTENIPDRYDVQSSIEESGFQILRYNFSYNYYVPMQKLPLFEDEASAWNYIKHNLEDW